jgi:hypothetical protein
LTRLELVDMISQEMKDNPHLGRKGNRFREKPR